MEKNRIIIVEGPQGTGKTTLTNYLRENIPSSNLYRLSGQKDKTLSGKKLSQKMYLALLSYLEKMEDTPMDLIFDRTFFTEEIYARLGYKEYSFTDIYELLVKKLESLNYDIYFIVLYLEDGNIYEERLKREHHTYQSFSVENSMQQQKAYLKMAEELRSSSIQVIALAMDQFETSYAKINQLFHIEDENRK